MENNKTYFVSEDIGLILKGNNCFKDFYNNKRITGASTQGLKKIRQSLKNSLTLCFRNVEIIPEQDMLYAMNTLVTKSCYPHFIFR